MKVKAISIYGFKTEEEPTEWRNYDKKYSGLKLVKGQDEGKDIEFTLNEKGYVNGIFLEKEPEVESKYKFALKTKIITALEPNILEDEVNIFSRKHNVKYNTPMVFGNYLVAYLLYED